MNSIFSVRLLQRFKFVRIYLLLIVALLIANCQSTYMYQRSKDTADLFTFALQSQSYGASVRTGPLKVGINYKSNDGSSIGLRGGEWGSFDDEDFSIFFLGSDILTDQKKPQPKAQPADQSQPANHTEINSEIEQLLANMPSTLKLRHKDVHARSPFGTQIPFQKANPLFKESKVKNKFAPIHHQTSIELSAGLYYGVKIGINIGELFDWLLGWAGADPFDDDLPINPNEIAKQLKDTQNNKPPAIH